MRRSGGKTIHPGELIETMHCIVHVARDPVKGRVVEESPSLSTMIVTPACMSVPPWPNGSVPCWHRLFMVPHAGCGSKIWSFVPKAGLGVLLPPANRLIWRATHPNSGRVRGTEVAILFHE